ncbi:hypothetical protein [Halomicrobium urmianum]|uniref:hypothetical protein n=1 Tax=Halomicrobium urmianum TaxID=1586233 RepID=UPI001CD9FA3E|nr:hypothetical protein [Halomicrobium urmianum]
MTRDFRDWLSCPECGEDGDVSALAYKTDLVLECRNCECTSEFVIGEDAPLRDVEVEEADGIDCD